MLNKPCHTEYAGCDNLVCYSQYDCAYYRFPNGRQGQVIGVTPDGKAGWVDASRIALPPGTTCFSTNTVAGALLQLCDAVKCDAIKDCVGTGMLVEGGLGYDRLNHRYFVVISPQTGNMLRQTSDGLHVSETPFAALTGQSISITPGGVAGHSPLIDVKLSTQPGNQITALGDGLFSRETNFSAIAGPAVRIVPGGVNGHAPYIDVALSPAAGNLLTSLPNGLFASETPFAPVEGLGVDITAGGMNGHAPTIALDLSEFPVGAAGVAGADSYIGPDNQAHLLPAAASETPFAAVAGQGVSVVSGGTNGHSPLISMDASTLLAGTQGVLGGTGSANTYIGADNQVHLLPAALSETSFAAVEGTAIDIIAGGTNGHAPTISVNTSEFPVGVQGALGGTGAANTYIGADNQAHLLPAALSETSFAAVEGTAIDIIAGGTNGHAPTISVNTSEFPAGAQGVAGTDSYIGNDNQAHLLPAALSLTTILGSKATLVTNTLNVPNPLPVASISVISKIALTASLDAVASSGAQDGNTLTYAWTAIPVTGAGAATFSAPAAAQTGVTFSAPGEYEITLTVTDLNGGVGVTTLHLSADRILAVGYVSMDVNSWFSSMTEAYNWINANDAANAALYTIFVYGLTTDTARLVPNAARVHFEPQGLIPVGVDFPAGVFRWSGDINRNTVENGINCSVGDTITAVAGTILQFEGVAINNIDATAAAVRGNAWTGVFNNCYFFGSGSCFVSTGASSLNILLSAADARGRNMPTFDIGGGSIVMEFCRLSHTRSDVLMLSGNVNGRVSNNDFNTNAPTIAGDVSRAIHIDTSAMTSTLVLEGNMINCSNNGVGGGYSCALYVTGSAGSTYVLGGSYNATQYGVVLHNSVGNNLVIANALLRGGNSVVGTSTPNTITLAAIGAARVHNCSLDGLPAGPVVFAAGTVTGTNVII